MFWNSAKSLFYSGGANYMPVIDLKGAESWYQEKFGVKRVNIELDDGEDCLALGRVGGPRFAIFETWGPRNQVLSG